MAAPYTTASILRMLLNNMKVQNLKDELLAVACPYGDAQMEASTGKVGWGSGDAYYGAAVGIAYKFAQAWAKYGNDTEAERSEEFKEAMEAAKELKDKLTATGQSSSVVIIQVDDYETSPANPMAFETFRTTPFGRRGGWARTPEEAAYGW
jgi:hypothetical protein